MQQQNKESFFTGGAGRFGFGNPFKFPGRSFSPNQVAGPMFNVSAGVSAFTTTNTVDYLYAYSGNIVTVGFNFTVLNFIASIKLKHSAPPASVDVTVFMDYGNATGFGVYIAYQLGLGIASSTLYDSFTLNGWTDLASKSMVPGLHTIGFAVRNNTAGTLAMGAAAASGFENTMYTSEASYRVVNI